MYKNSRIKNKINNKIRITFVVAPCYSKDILCDVQISKAVGFKVEPKPDSSLADMNELGLTKYLNKCVSFSQDL